MNSTCDCRMKLSTVSSHNHSNLSPSKARLMLFCSKVWFSKVILKIKFSYSESDYTV